MEIVAFSNPFYAAYFQSDFLGKGIFLALYALSILTWAIIVYKVWLTWQVRGQRMAFSRLLQAKKGTILEIEVEKREKGVRSNPFLQLYSTLKSHTLEILNKNRRFGESSCLSTTDIEVVEGHLYTTIASETQFLDKYLYILSIVIGLAPFLGLLGTVWGILLTFSELQQAGSVSSSQAFLGGISLALGTTVIGLVNAIPALVGYKYLKNCVSDIVIDMEGLSHEMLATVEMQYRKVDLL